MSNDVTAEQLTGAMRTMENDVALPKRIRQHSVVGNLIALSPGDVFTLSLEVAEQDSLAKLQSEADRLKSKMRSSMTSSIRNAKQHCSSVFSMESALVMYPSGRVFVQIVVTCKEEKREQPVEEEYDI